MNDKAQKTGQLAWLGLNRVMQRDRAVLGADARTSVSPQKNQISPAYKQGKSDGSIEELCNVMKVRCVCVYVHVLVTGHVTKHMSESERQGPAIYREVGRDVFYLDTIRKRQPPFYSICHREGCIQPHTIPVSWSDLQYSVSAFHSQQVLWTFCARMNGIFLTKVPSGKFSSL